MAAKKLLRLRDCAERSGHQESTWRAWVQRGKVPHYKVGHSIRIAEEDLERLIEQARVPAREGRSDDC
jgi:excisionase family DNA binding protein